MRLGPVSSTEAQVREHVEDLIIQVRFIFGPVQTKEKHHNREN